MRIEHGHTVTLHYEGRLRNGLCFDSSWGRAPLVCVVGAGRFLPAFEEALVGHACGERFSIVLEPEQAFGLRKHERLFVLSREGMACGQAFSVGQFLRLGTEDGEMDVRVLEMHDRTLVADANHPLAGETLYFIVEICSIR